MIQLYSKQDIKTYAARRALMIAACVLLVFLALGACVLMCLNVRSANAEKRQVWAIVISTLAGWGYWLGLRPLRIRQSAELKHAESMLSDSDTQCLEGVITVSPLDMRIPGSIKVQRVKLAGGRETTLFVNRRKAPLLPNGSHVKLLCEGSYIKAYEVQNEVG